MGNGLIKPAPNVMVQELEDELVFLNLNNEHYFSLDKVGRRFWEVLQAVDSVDKAVDILLEEFDTDAQTLRGDIIDLIADLQDSQLVV